MHMLYGKQSFGRYIRIKGSYRVAIEIIIRIYYYKRD
jgi:hypothetical protein